MFRLFAFLLIILSTTSCSQQSKIPQPKVLLSGNHLSDATINSNGNLILIGASQDNKGILAAINESDTSIAWSTAYEADGGMGFTKIISDRNKDYIVTGTQQSDSSNALVISKLDSRGNVLWSKKFKDCNGKSDTKLTIIDGGNIVVSCSANNTSLSPMVFLNVFCLNEQGELIWNKKIEQLEKVVGLQKYANGLILVAKQKGAFLNITDGMKYYNFPVFLLDSKGEMIDIANSILTPKTPDTDLDFENIIASTNGQFLLLGYTKNGLSPYKAMSVICFDASAKSFWAKRYDCKTDGIFRVGNYNEKNKKTQLWADSYGSSTVFYSCLINEKGDVEKTTSYTVPTASNIKNISSSASKTILSWNQAAAFAFVKTDEQGQIGLQGEKVTTKGVDIPTTSRKNAMTVLSDSTFSIQPFTLTSKSMNQ